MQNKHPLLHSFGHAILVFLYIAAVAWVMSNGGTLFGPDKSFLTPLAILLLFVLSAIIVGGLVLGRPILLYINDQKAEGLKFLGYTIVWMFVITLIVFSWLFWMQ